MTRTGKVKLKTEKREDNYKGVVQQNIDNKKKETKTGITETRTIRLLCGLYIVRQSCWGSTVATTRVTWDTTKSEEEKGIRRNRV